MLLGAELGLPSTLLDNHASYINSWVSLLEDQTRAILSAGKHAEVAVSYLFEIAGMQRHSHVALATALPEDHKRAAAA